MVWFGVVCIKSFLLPSYCHICGISIIIKNGKNIAFHEIPVFNIPHIFAIVFNHVTGRYIIDIKFYSFLFDVYNAVVALSWFCCVFFYFICAFRSYSFEPHTHQTKPNPTETNQMNCSAPCTFANYSTNIGNCRFLAFSLFDEHSWIVCLLVFFFIGFFYLSFIVVFLIWLFAVAVVDVMLFLCFFFLHSIIQFCYQT